MKWVKTFWTYSSPELFYYCQVVVQRVTFQFQCSSESTNGTGVQGGQIPEIIFYGPSGQ